MNEKDTYEALKRSIIGSAVILIAVLIALSVPIAYASLTGGNAADYSPVGIASATDPPDDFGPWTGDIDNLNQPTNDTLTTNGEQAIIETQRDTSESNTQLGFILKFSELSGNSGDETRIYIRNSNNHVIQIKFIGDGTGYVYDGSDQYAFTWRPNINYSVELRNIDYGNNNFDLYLNGQNTGTFNFISGASGFDEIWLYQSTSGELATNFYDMRLDGPNHDIDRFEGGTIKDFTDGQQALDDNGFSGFYDSSGNLDNSFGIESFEGQGWANFTVDNENSEMNAWTNSGYYSPNSFGIKVNVRNITGVSEGANIMLRKDDNNIINLEMDYDGQASIFDGSTQSAFSWRPGITYHIEFRNIDWQNNNFDLFVNGENLGNYNFQNNMDSFEQIHISQDTRASNEEVSLYFNDLRMDGQNYEINRFPGGVLKGHGDGDTQINTTGWRGYYDLSGNKINPVTIDSVENTPVGNLSGGNTIEAWTASGSYSPDNFSVKVQLSDLDGTSRTNIMLRNAGNHIINLEIDHDGTIDIVTPSGEAQVYQYRPGITYAIEFYDIDWQNNEFKLSINGEPLGTYSFENNGNEIDSIRILHQSGSGPLHFDDIRLNGVSIEKPEYTPANTAFGWKGWFNGLNKYDRGLQSDTISVDGARNDSQIWSSGGFVNISTFGTDITVSDRTIHPDDTVEFWAYHFSDDQMAVRLHMSTPADQFDPSSDIEGNAITVRDGGAWREINQTWNNDTANSIEFVNVEPQNQSYGVRINGVLVENPATGTNHFSMSGNLEKGLQNFELEIDTTVSGSLGEYPDSNMTVEYSDLSLGRCGNNCEAVEFFEVTSEEPIEFEDPGIPGSDQPGATLILQINAYMSYNGTQTYTVIFESDDTERTDVTNEASVSSSNSTVVSVDSANNQLVATGNNQINRRINITAEYSGLEDIQNVTVANRSMENIGILPSTQWPAAVLGTDDAQAKWGIGSEIQWIFLAILFGGTMGRLFRNEWIANGTLLFAIFLFWLLGNVSLGIMLSGMAYSFLAGLVALQVPQRTNINVNTERFGR